MGVVHSTAIGHKKSRRKHGEEHEGLKFYGGGLLKKTSSGDGNDARQLG